jgi:hypothetical protein
MDRGTMVQLIALVVTLQWSNAATVSPGTLLGAQTEVARLYRNIGVTVEWSRAGSADVRRDRLSLHVVVVDDEVGELRSRRHPVMGAALRTEYGTGVVYVFSRRVEKEAARYDVSQALVLACAIAHEIGHLLLPDRGHSTTGLMRGVWDREDFERACQGQLRFSAEQATLIRAAVAGGPEHEPRGRGPDALVTMDRDGGASLRRER